MRVKSRSKYLLGSLRFSAAELCVSMFLLALACAFLVVFPGLNENQITSLLVGVVSGIIATLALSVVGKYTESKRAYETIHALLNNVILEAKNCVKHKSCCSNEIISFGYQYTDMCRQSVDLTYKKDYEEVSCAMKRLVSCKDLQDFEQVIAGLEQARNSMFN